MAVAVNVTDVPAQTEFPEGTMLTLTGNNGFTVMLTGLEVEGLPETQDKFEVSTQVTTSPEKGV